MCQSTNSADHGSRNCGTFLKRTRSMQQVGVTLFTTQASTLLYECVENMQARVRNNSASDGGWEELSLPDEVRSINSSVSSEDDEILILGGSASPRIEKLSTKREESVSKALSPTIATLEVLVPPNVPAPARPANKVDDIFASSVVSPPIQTAQAWTVHPSAKNMMPSPADLDKALSPIEKTLLHQITRLTEELEVSRQKNDVLEQAIHREDFNFLQDDDCDNNSAFLRLGLKTLGFFLLLSVVQRKFLVSGFVSIFGAAVVGGLLTYEQESAKRRRGE